MAVTLLNENQQRRLGTHLRLLAQDLDALADVPDARARSLINAIREATEAIRADLELPLDRGPSLGRRVGAVAEVWAARVHDLRARRLSAYGAVHPALAARLDPRLDQLRQLLEALAEQASRLPER
jgi:hypothetical protein